MRRQEFGRRLALGELAHLLPQRHRRRGIVARARRELDADLVGFALAFAAVRQLDRRDRRHLHQRSGVALRAERDRHQLRADAGAVGDRHALLRVVGERVADLVPHHLRDLVVAGFELLDQPGVHRHLAAGHAEGVHRLRIVDQLHFPVPLCRVGPEAHRLRDQAIGDLAQVLRARRAGLDLLLLGEPAHHAVVGRRRLADRHRLGHHHQLAAAGQGIGRAAGEDCARGDPGKGSRPRVETYFHRAHFKVCRAVKM